MPPPPWHPPPPWDFFPPGEERYEAARGHLVQEWKRVSMVAKHHPRALPSGRKAIHYKKSMEMWVNVRPQLKQKLGFRDMEVELEAFDSPDHGPMLSCDVDHTEPGISTRGWEPWSHGGQFYSVQNTVGYGLLPSEDESKGHRFETGKSGLYQSTSLERAKSFSIPVQLFGEEEGWQRVAYETLADPAYAEMRVNQRGEPVHRPEQVQVKRIIFFMDAPPIKGEPRFSEWNPDLECKVPGRTENNPMVYYHRESNGPVVHLAPIPKVMATTAKYGGNPPRLCKECDRTVVKVEEHGGSWHCSHCMVWRKDPAPQPYPKVYPKHPRTTSMPWMKEE